jgi:hypothetical protein
MHKKKNFKSKRVDNWLIHLQDLIPQITEIKYYRGKNNNGPDYLTRYEMDNDEPTHHGVNAVTRSMKRNNESNPSETVAVRHGNPKVPSSRVGIMDFSWDKIKHEQSSILAKVNGN